MFGVQGLRFRVFGVLACGCWGFGVFKVSGFHGFIVSRFGV